jgi:hypothetical protein
MDTSDAGRSSPAVRCVENAVGAAGYRYSIKGGGREDEALRDLQDELDAAHLPLVCWQDGGKTVWSLCVGYDSERGEVMLQNRGAQFDTLAAKRGPQGGKRPRVRQSLHHDRARPSRPWQRASPDRHRRPPQQQQERPPTPRNLAPDATPVPIIATAPSFVWQIAQLKEESPIRRTARRAAILLTRGGSNTQLLGIAALDAWTTTRRRHKGNAHSH